MKHYLTETIPEQTREVCSHITCDFCGRIRSNGKWRDLRRDVPDISKYLDHGNWSSADVRFSMEASYSYPEGTGAMLQQNIDVCPACWFQRVVPWLASQNVALNVREDAFE